MKTLTKYKLEYSRQVVDYMATGHSLRSFAHLIGVSKDTITPWKKRYPEFRDACILGKRLFVLNKTAVVKKKEAAVRLKEIEYHKKYYTENIDAIRVYKQKWYLKKRDRILAKSKGGDSST